jgi:transposase-like protein
MVLTEEEIERAADVFPLYYEDIQKCHAVVHGTDPFETLIIAPENRRLRIEQELREARIRLRRAVVDGRGDERALGRAVSRKLRQVRFPLRALLELVGVECESHALDIVVEKACRKFGVESSSLRRVEAKPEAAYDALSMLLGRAIDVVDHLGEPAPSAPGERTT